jgi:DNA-directed RNA polymerase delta subunit
MPSRVGRRLYKVRFTKHQREQLQAVWEHKALDNIPFSRAPETERPTKRPWNKSDNAKGAAQEGEEDSSGSDLSEDNGSDEEGKDEIEGENKEDQDEEGMDDEYKDEDGMDDEEEDDKDVGQGCGPSIAGRG